MIKSFIISYKWLLVGTLAYMLSWVTYTGPNLSFLAWISFAFLFVHLYHRQSRFLPFFLSSFVFITAWTLISAGWLFRFPLAKWQIALCILNENIHISMPFIILFFIHKIIGFEKALLTFPFLWVGWEWLYIETPHTMGTHLLAYGQASNLWLIQMADFGGMWLISLWVMSFNVACFFLMKQHGFSIFSKSFMTKITKMSLIFIIPVLLYSAIQWSRWTEFGSECDKIQASIIPTQFEADYLMNPSNRRDIVEKTLHRNDSLAFTLISENRPSDLYVWPETGTQNWMAYDNIKSLLFEATKDWGASHLSGSIGRPLTKDNGENNYISGVLISPGTIDDENIQYHHKTRLIPVNEAIPYLNFIKLVFNKVKLQNRMKIMPGRTYEALDLLSSQEKKYKLGVSLCYEQWFPEVWAKLTANGAQFFAHLAAEGWYGKTGFQLFMANVSRLRAVENRRAVVRASNVGLSLFTDPLGRFYNAVDFGSLEMPSARVEIHEKLSFFTRHPNWTPVISLMLFIAGLLKGILDCR